MRRFLRVGSLLAFGSIGATGVFIWVLFWYSFGEFYTALIILSAEGQMEVSIGRMYLVSNRFEGFW